MKVLIVDDHPIVLSGCRALLQPIAEIELLEAATGSDALAAYREHKPDVAVIDINLPDVSGLALAKTILSEDPQAKVLMFSMNDDPIFVSEAFKAGAKGYASKNGDPRSICDAILKVAEGDIWLPPDVAALLARMSFGPDRQAADFTARELEILRLLAKGKTMSEVAAAIGVSYKTTATTCAALRDKLGARTALEMISIALERRII